MSRGTRAQAHSELSAAFWSGHNTRHGPRSRPVIAVEPTVPVLADPQPRVEVQPATAGAGGGGPGNAAPAPRKRRRARSGKGGKGKRRAGGSKQAPRQPALVLQPAASDVAVAPAPAGTAAVGPALPAGGPIASQGGAEHAAVRTSASAPPPLTWRYFASATKCLDLNA